MKKIEYPSLFDDDFEVESRIKVVDEKFSAKIEKVFTDTNPLMFMSFGSGSSGNCCYLGTRDEGILIDAGVEGKTVEEEMLANGLNINNVKGILVTHDHGDHVKYLYNIVRYHKHIRIFATPRTMIGLLQKHGISRRVKEYHHPIYKEIPFTVGGMTVTAFEVMHDGSDNAGFFISTDQGNFAISTDLGCISDRVDFYLSQASFIVMEANYDATMLREGRYPEYLKARIVARNGHMDNVETASFLKKIYTPQLTHIFLCHLSHDNNKPEIALKAVQDALTDAGVTDFSNGLPSLTDTLSPVNIAALPRFKSSPLYLLKKRK